MRHREIHWAPLRLVVFCVFAAIPAHADFVLSYIGVTAIGSSLAGNPIAVGTPFEIDSSFPDAMTPVGPGIPGIGLANTDSITIDIGGASYSAIHSGYSYVDFYDLTNPTFSGLYVAGLFTSDGASNGGFAPLYTTATPLLDALNPNPTVFSGFLGDVSATTSLPFSTAAGELIVTYDPATSLTTSITSPEPGAFVPLGAAFGCIALLLRRKRAKVFFH